MKKMLGLSVVLALSAQMFVPVSHAETLTESVQSELNVSETFHTKNSPGTALVWGYGVKDVDSDGDGTADTITWKNKFVTAETEGVGRDAIAFSKSEGFYIAANKFKQKDGYYDLSVKINFDTSISVDYKTQLFMLPYFTYQNGAYIYKNGTENLNIVPVIGEWTDYRILFDYKEDEDVIYKRLYAKNTEGVFEALTDWANTGSNSSNTANMQCDIRTSAPDEIKPEMYVSKLKLATVNDVNLMFPELVGMEGSGNELKLYVSTDLNAASVTAENLDIPVGTVTNVSYKDKVITLTGTELAAAFLTENILSADGMPAKTSSFENSVSDSVSFELNINESFAEKTNNAYVNSASVDKVSYVPAADGERAYLAFSEGAYAYAAASIEKEGYFDWGVRTSTYFSDATQIVAIADKIGIKLQGNRWIVSGDWRKTNNEDWYDFRMLVRKEEDGTLSKKYLLKNDDGIYEDISSWVTSTSSKIDGWFTCGANLPTDVSEFKNTYASSSTWYPEIIGTEVLLGGKILRVYTNRPLMASTVNENSVMLATGSADSIVTKDNVITIMGEGLTTADITGEVATADGMRKGVKTATYSSGAVTHDCGTVTLTVSEALTDDEIASLENVKLVAGDSEISAEAEYSAEDLTITLTFAELERLAYTGNPESLQQAVYEIVIPGMKVDGSVTVSDIPYEWLQVSSEYKSASNAVEGITYNAGAPEFVAETESSRAYLLGKDDSETEKATLFYGFKASGHTINEPFYVDMALDATNGQVRLSVANATDISGAAKGWPVVLDITGDVTDKYPNCYVAADGFAEFRIALTQKANGGFERTVYNKNADGNYVVVEDTDTWKTSANTQVAGGLNYLTFNLAEGGKIAGIEIYKENPEKLIPTATDAKFTETGATFTFSHDMADITADNVKVYEGETEISKEISYDTTSNTLTVTASDATKVVIDGVYAKNGMPAEVITISRSLGADLVITDVDGNILSDLVEVSSVKATAEIKNKNADATTYSMYIARYNNGKLISVVSDNKEVTAGAWASFEAALTVDGGFAAGDTVRAYLWDENMTPVCDPAEVNYSVVETLAQNDVLAARVASEIAEGDDLDVVYIGGSITQGTSASPNWVTLVGNVFEEAYPEKVTNHNVGVGGTTSVWGITRFDKDVLSNDPDVVFIEFAVNDTNLTTTQSKEAMEGMVRQLNALENPPMVAFVYTTTYSDANGSVIAAHQEIADYYNIPSVNLRDYVWNTYWGGVAPTDEQVAAFWTDKTHPTALGYSVYADCIIANMAKDGFFRYPETKDAPYMESYIKSTGKWLTTEALEETIQDFYGWELGTGTNATLSRSEESGDASLIAFTFEGSMFSLKYDCYTDKGDIIVTIDDTITKTLNGYYDNGSGGHALGVYGVYDLLEGEHTVTIEFAENSGRKNASITDIIVAK